jgi:hypothetical protein
MKLADVILKLADTISPILWDQKIGSSLERCLLLGLSLAEKALA